MAEETTSIDLGALANFGNPPQQPVSNVPRPNMTPSGSNEMMGAPNFMLEQPYQNTPNYVGTPVKTLSSGQAEANILGGLENMAMMPKATPDVARQGQVQPFSADINHTKYERYYAHPDFQKLGFSPFRDNETFYNENTSGWSDFQRTFSQWRSLVGMGFTDAMSFGPSSDRDAGRKMEKAMAIGSSTRGGVGGFASNLFLNSGYTFGIISEMLVEEAILFAVTAATGGATSGTMAASIASKMKLLDKATDITNIANKTAKVVDTVDDLQDINKARSFWQKAQGVGATVGQRLMPATGDLIQNWNKMDNLSSLAKTTTSAASFYKDIRNIRLAYGESALEAGMVENEMLDQLYHETLMKNNGQSLNAEQMQQIRKQAKDASMVTFGMNFPTIFLSNAIVFDNMFNSFSPIKNILSEPVRKNIAGELVQEVGKKVSPLQIVDSNFKGMLKSFTKPRTYAKYGLNYFRANIAEGVQESLQEVIAGTTKDFYKQDPNSPVRQGFYEMLGSNFKKQVSPEGFEVFASGFLMGGPVNMVTSFAGGAVEKIKNFRNANYKEQKAQAMDDLLTKQKTWNEVYDDPFYYYDVNLENAENQVRHRENMERAEHDGDQKVYYDLKHASETEHILTVMDMGSMDTMIDRMESFTKMTPEEIKENFPKMKNPEQYQAKADKIIARAKSLQGEYDMIKSRFPAPVDPRTVSKADKDLYNTMSYNYLGWKNSVKQLLFMRSSFANNVNRANSVMQAAQAELGATKISGADFASLADTPSGVPGSNLTSLKQLILQKTKALEALQYVDESSDQESQDLKRSEEMKLKALMKFALVQDQMNGLSETASDNDRLAVEDNYGKAFTDVLTALNDGQTLLADQVENTMQKLIDYNRLSKEGALVKASVNYLMNPDNFSIHYARNVEAVTLGHKNRQSFLEAAMKAYMESMINNYLLKDLFNEAGVFLTPEDTEALVKEGIFPKRMYYNTDEKAEVEKTSPTWKKATDIINDYLKNVKDIPIPEAEGSEYDTKARVKLPEDKRNLEDLATQYGFVPNTKTRVSARKTLETVSNSTYATEAERLLAAKLMSTVSEEDYYEYDFGLGHPGYYSSADNQIYLDPRYTAEGYKNGGLPIEVLILHEEIHRKTVKQLEEDPQFRNQMQLLYDTVTGSEAFAEKTKERGAPAYGTKNLAEFVAEAMSNSDFQDMLSKIPAPAELQTTTVWAAFVDAVLEFLNSTLSTESVGLIKYKRLDGSVLNAALDIITTKIDATFGGKEAEVQSGRVITSQTPVANMPLEVKRDLLYSFKQANEAFKDLGRDPILKNIDNLSDDEIYSSYEFQNWVKNAPPQVTAAIDKFNAKMNEGVVEKEPKKKPSPLRYSGANPTSSIVVTRTVDGQRQVLMVKRNEDAVEGGKWALPGGFLDTEAKKGQEWKPGTETQVEAAIRELKEETGLDISELDPKTIESIGTFEKEANKDPRNTATSWVTSEMFSVDIPADLGDTIEGADDASEAKWFTIDEVNALATNEVAFNHGDVLTSEELRTTPFEAAVVEDTVVELSERDKEKQEKLRPLIERRQEIQTEIEELRKALEADVEPTPEEAESFDEAKKAAQALKKQEYDELTRELIIKDTELRNKGLTAEDIVKNEEFLAIRDKRDALEKEIGEGGGLLAQAEGFSYFDYPTLGYEEGTKNVVDALDNFKENKVYDVDQVDAILQKLNANDFTLSEFAKIKDILKKNGVTLVASYGGQTELGNYGEFILDRNRVILNMSTLLMDAKVETGAQIAQVIVHEMIHGVVAYKTNQKNFPQNYPDAVKLTAQEKTAIANLEYVYEQILEDPIMDEDYGLRNVDEMIAELANPEFVEKLKSIKVDTTKLQTSPKAKNLFEVVIDAIVKLVTGKPLSESAYDIIYRNYEALIANGTTEQQKAFKDRVVEEKTKLKTVTKENSLKYRKKEYEITQEEMQMETPLRRRRLRMREDRLTEPGLYDNYLTQSGGLNTQKILERIQELEMELASIEAQISAIEDEYSKPAKGATPYLQPGERDKLSQLGYSPTDIRAMGSAEARIRINSGLTKNEFNESVNKDTAEAERIMDEERAAIRNKLNNLLDSVETFEDLKEADEYAKEILIDPDLRLISNYSAEEIAQLFDNKKKELAEKVKFQDLKVGTVVMKNQNPDSKFIVVKKTAKQIQIRKFGDPLAKIEYINVQDLNDRIKYVYNPFMEEMKVESQMPSPEAQELIKQDTETAKSLNDAESITEDMNMINNMSKDEVDDDFFSTINDNCK
jgi:ADP-ribose pyrophosphatase YjhB (NUDIX family)